MQQLKEKEIFQKNGRDYVALNKYFPRNNAKNSLSWEALKIGKKTGGNPDFWKFSKLLGDFCSCKAQYDAYQFVKNTHKKLGCSHELENTALSGGLFNCSCGFSAEVLDGFAHKEKVLVQITHPKKN